MQSNLTKYFVDICQFNLEVLVFKIYQKHNLYLEVECQHELNLGVHQHNIVWIS